MLLIKGVRLLPLEEGRDNPQDLLIHNGLIEKIGPDLSDLESKAEVWASEGELWASPGWFDLGAQGADPGFEHREDLASLARAATAGGFTGTAVFPNTHPAVHSKAEVLYIQHKQSPGPTTLLPIGALSQDCAGKDMAELYDMHAAGAVAFSDGLHPVQDAGLLLRALEYVKPFNGLIIQQPYSVTLAAGGQMHEGAMSTSLGLRGLPALAEEITIQRDLSLLQYTGGRLHLHLISTARGVELIRQAKQAGLPVTASVALANLCFTDAELENFDSNWKLMPPLRSETDRQALLEGLQDGTLDFICTNHTPWDEESKNLEFPYAEFGMSALETALALSSMYLLDALGMNMLVEKWAFGARRILGLPLPELREGNPAEITLFDPTAEWTLRADRLHSKGRNTALIGRPLRGRVLATINKEHIARF